MTAFIHFLERTGAASLDVFWLPVLIWTAIALLAVSFMKKYEHKISAAYQYYNRVALLWGLAVGVIGSALLHYFPIGSSGEVAGATGFIVIQNPIAVTASAATSAINWWDPALWIGIATILVIIIAAGALIKLVIDFISLNLFSKTLSSQNPPFINQLTANNKHLLLKFNGRVNVIFSNEVDVPCTFGWFRKHIVLPASLHGNSDKLNMALRHELTHILNNDYLLNNTVQSIKALFFFHPLVHKLNRSIEEYREIFCDQYVLQDAQISQKRYAKLLFELSPKPVFKPSAAVNMAVHFSTLKKRIQTMQKPTPNLPSLKWSISLMLIATLMITGLMACSTTEKSSTNQSKGDDTQTQIRKTGNDREPLYVLNGQIVNKENIISRLKPKYIESIQVWKQDKVPEKYGKKGKDGVVEITLIDREKALTDLYTYEEMIAMKKQEQENMNPDKQEQIFMAVEDEPKLIGGLMEVQKHVEYPKSCRQAGIQGRVTLQFIVTKEGNAEDIKVLRGIGGGCDAAAIEAVEKYAKFEPGKQRGQAVNVRYSLPIQFKLDSNNNGADDSSKVKQGAAFNLSNDVIALDKLVVTAYGYASQNPIPNTSALSNDITANDLIKQ